MTLTLALKELSDIGHIISFRPQQILGLCKDRSALPAGEVSIQDEK